MISQITALTTEAGLNIENMVAVIEDAAEETTEETAE